MVKYFVDTIEFEDYIAFIGASDETRPAFRHGHQSDSNASPIREALLRMALVGPFVPPGTPH